MTNKYEKITLYRDDEPKPLTFDGKQIGFAIDRPPDLLTWTQVSLFKTKGRKYILYLEHLTVRSGEPTWREPIVYDTLNDVFEGFERRFGDFAYYFSKKIQKQVKAAGIIIRGDKVA